MIEYTIEQTKQLTITIGILVALISVLYILYMLEYTKRVKAEKYIYMEADRGDMTEYENFKKWWN